ncbi:MAG: hypothetical protein LBV06_03565 [Propionibacteriaceae bacterium]|jgi:hypothetical protein|nr:hypothetical protein [Propionibacteriaceae bacterium]
MASIAVDAPGKSVPACSSDPSLRLKINPLLTTTLAIVGLLLALAACGAIPADPEQSDTVPYAEPGWMANTRADIEREGGFMVSCMAEQGWTLVIESDDSWSSGTELAEEQYELWSDSIDKCVTSLSSETPEPGEAEWRVRYQHMLDTRACLIDQGYDITSPPSEDAWVDAALNDRPLFAPWRDIVDRVGTGTLTMDQETYYALYALCTQDGPTVSMSW